MTFGKRNSLESAHSASSTNEDAPSRPVIATAWVAIILGSTMILLCGLCTGGVVLTPWLQAGPATEAEMGSYFFISVIALGVGALGIIPGTFLILIGRSLKRKKPHVGYGIAMSLMAVPVVGIAGMMTSINDKVISQSGEFLAWFAVLTFLGGIWIIITAIWKSKPVQNIKASPQLLAARQSADRLQNQARQALNEKGKAPDNQGLATTAKIILIIALLVMTLSGLCTIGFAIAEDNSQIAILLLGGLFVATIGLLAFAMRRHLQYGPNLLSEIIAILFGLLTLGVGGIGLFFIGWAIWSIIVRKRANTHD